MHGGLLGPRRLRATLPRPWQSPGASPGEEAGASAARDAGARDAGATASFLVNCYPLETPVLLHASPLAQ